MIVNLEVWMMRVASFLLIAVLAVLGSMDAMAKKGEPDRVVVQHILIGFKKSVSGKKLDRTKKEAQVLAEELLKRALDGEDFDALVKEYTNDKYPGIMSVTNDGAPARSDSHRRSGLVPAFGQVAFSLEVSEIGMAKFSYGSSPYGWHIIKRLE